MRRVVILGLMTLAACDKPAEMAEAQFEIVSRDGTDAEQCEAARKVTAAWLERQDQDKYDDWKRRQDIYCMSAQFGISEVDSEATNELDNAAAAVIEAAEE